MIPACLWPQSKLQLSVQRSSMLSESICALAGLMATVFAPVAALFLNKLSMECDDDDGSNDHRIERSMISKIA